MSRFRFLPVALLAFASACSEQPVEPTLSPGQTSEELSPFRSGFGQADKGVDRAALLTEIPVSTDEFDGWISITQLSVDTDGGARQLLADVAVTWIDENGVYTGELLEDQPVDISRVAASTASAISIPSGLNLDRSPSETGVCDILYLTLGPLDLDLLGMTLDLSVIELDLDAVAGSGNLLGNLLCAVTGLLDGGPLASLLNLLGSINDLLDGITSILDGIAVIGSVVDDILPTSTLALKAAPGTEGSFAGSLSVTSLNFEPETGSLLVSGVLNGRVRNGKKTTQLRDVAIEDVPATLTSGGTSSPIGASLLAPAESDVCDILYLDLAPTYLDLLGLTVDLAEVELDLDAVPGDGNLLGNLLCAVTGLLDGAAGGGLGGLLESLLQGVLDLVNQLLGGLSL